MNNFKPYILITIVIITILLITVYLIYQNTYPTITKITIKNKNIPKAFNGYKIVQISDYHNAHLLRGHDRLLFLIKNAKPDIIVITGDFFDSRRTDIDSSLSFVKELSEISPCYYIAGNHESRKNEIFKELLSEFDKLNITVLNNRSISLELNNEALSLIGITDPAFYVDENDHNGIKTQINQNLKEAIPNNNNFKILLSHRPEHIDIYAKHGADLVLSGHAHGGQIRFPFKNGIIAPGQGFFPKYTSGLYILGKTDMIVSRGIGNSKFPFRINNRPEVVVISLESE